MSMQTHSDRRRDLLTGEWMLVSPQRDLTPESAAEGMPEALAGGD